MASMMRRSRPLEPKGQNFSFHEKMLLLDLISEHGRSLVEENDTLSLFRRSRIWRLLHAEFNRHQGVTQRTEKQLRLLWKNQKARCKREFRSNAAKYRGPNCFIHDPLLRKMSTLIGVEDDDPKPIAPAIYRGPPRGRRPSMRLSPAARAETGEGYMVGETSQGPRIDHSSIVDEPSPSQIQIAKSYGMGPDVATMTSSSSQQLPASSSSHGHPNPLSEGMSGITVLGSVVADAHLENFLGSPSSPQVHDASSSSQLENNHGLYTSGGNLPNSDPAPNRRKKAVPRKASEMIKAEADEEDDVIHVESNGQWNEERVNEEKLSESPSSILLDALATSDAPRPATNVINEPTYNPGLVPHNNLHQQLSVRQFKPSIRGDRARAPPIKSRDKRERVRDLGRQRVRSERVEQRQHAVNGGEVYVENRLGVVESAVPPPSSGAADTPGGSGKLVLAGDELQAEMLRMAKKEHDTKMATMLMKRKQAMQIKRSEHLAKMENYRLNKEILRLKKKKLELEIRNSMYLEEVEDELDASS